uniref:RING-type domain-containing protein n=1 Tax=Hanusia phi TaxID=3032 RepID=A0A7S0HR94_9CRYP
MEESSSPSQFGWELHLSSLSSKTPGLHQHNKMDDLRDNNNFGNRQTTASNTVGGMIFPIIIALVCLICVTLIREFARIMWRRALMRSMEEVKANQMNWVLSGAPVSEDMQPIFESGRWGMRWRDGRQERFTRLNLRADRNGGYIRGTGQDCIGESLIEGRFDPSRDRIAWTQMYQLRRGIIHMEIWGEFGREDGGQLVARGNYQSTDSFGARGFFVLRPVLVESMINLIIRSDRIDVLPPVDLLPVSSNQEGETHDMTCAVCLEESNCTTGGALPCHHIFHRECINKWLERHNDCPTCKQQVRPSEEHTEDQQPGLVIVRDERPQLNLRREYLRGSNGLHQLDDGLFRLEQSLVDLEQEFRTMMERVPQFFEVLAGEQPRTRFIVRGRTREENLDSIIADLDDISNEFSRNIPERNAMSLGEGASASDMQEISAQETPAPSTEEGLSRMEEGQGQGLSQELDRGNG